MNGESPLSRCLCLLKRKSFPWKCVKYYTEVYALGSWNVLMLRVVREKKELDGPEWAA